MWSNAIGWENLVHGSSLTIEDSFVVFSPGNIWADRYQRAVAAMQRRQALALSL
jgi:hypothetical protein